MCEVCLLLVTKFVFVAFGIDSKQYCIRRLIFGLTSGLALLINEDSEFAVLIFVKTIKKIVKIMMTRLGDPIARSYFAQHISHTKEHCHHFGRTATQYHLFDLFQVY